ncbi:MAG: ubiquinone/menaquinone biosynthesis C-methylase UbiE [Gammaproteobacteria bacterium]|jgi:ubiquinone/menaquinone biosynthesis C-methylase UbiE
MNKDDNTYIPALKFNWLTGIYDPVIALTTRERAFKTRLIKQAAIRDGHEVLDVGSGTGTLSIWIKKKTRAAYVTGLDGDEKILSIARRKAKKAGVDINFTHGMSYEMPYQDERFDRVLSSLFFHHLNTQNKERTFRECFRVIKPGGQLHIADWGKPANGLMRLLFYQIQLLDGFKTTEDNIRGYLPPLMRISGFENVEIFGEVSTIFGTMTLYRAIKPV